MRDYYSKLGRKVLMGVTPDSSSVSSGSVVTSDWTELRDGDSVIRRRAMLSTPSEKVTASKQYSVYSKEAEETLLSLLQSYNINKGGPRQVAGTDASAQN